MSDRSDLHPEPVVIAVHASRGEAEVTAAHLRTENIEAVIVDQTEGGALLVDGEPGVAVLVPADVAGRARELL